MITGSLKNRENWKEKDNTEAMCTPENAHTNEGG